MTFNLLVFLWWEGQY